MQDISKIATYGRNSFTKASRVKPRAYKRKTVAYSAFTIKGKGSSYLVRIARESRRILGECTNLATGEACQGFHFSGHCYHLGRALILMGK